MGVSGIFFAVCSLVKVLSDDAFILTNPGYPNPYKGTITNVEQGKGVAVLFHQFLANAGDCVTACDVNSTCQSLCGDVMDHPKTKKILITNSSATITIQSTAPADGNYHTGIYAKSISFDLATRSYFDCNTTVALKDGEPFFLVSQNYPNTPYQFSRCETTFAATDAIRVAVYDLVTVNDVSFKGPDGTGKLTEVKLSGRHVTDDEPLALYFLKSLQVSFAFSNRTTYYSRGFYILVDSFKRGPTSSQACVNKGAVTFFGGDSVTFGTESFGSNTYAANMECSYKFSNELKDYQLAISMEFETEKCCDIMLIDGIAPPPYNLYNYQGFMQRMFQFASSKVVTMNFTSDGAVQGVGFNGTVYNIDCGCGSGARQLTPNSTSLQIASPGFLRGAPTYCPNLDCFWTVNFPIDYEVTLNVSAVNLRAASQLDQLVIADTGRILLRSNSTIYYGPKKFLITSGLVSVNFTSSSKMAFPPPLAQEGFLLELNMVKKTIRRTTITFTDEYFMADISTRSFREGLDATYEYIISARPGRQVVTHFFTTIDGIANLEIYDGSDTSTTMIDTSFLLNRAIVDGVPLSLSSTGGQLLVRITPNRYNTKQKLDFQAMVTDWNQEEGCPPLVFTASTPSQPAFIQLSGSNCLHIFHANNDYDTSAGIMVRLENSSKLALYKGLTTNASHLMNSDSTNQYPSFIYGAYVVIHYSSPQNNIVTYSWSKRGFVTTLTMSSNDSGIIMSQDYLPQYPLNAMQQQFSIELMSDSEHMTGIRIEILKPTGQGYGTMQMQRYNKLLREISYPAKDGKTVFEQCGTKMIISYISPGGMSNGLYARYSRGSQSCNSGSLSSHSFFCASLFIFWIIVKRHMDIAAI